MTENVQRNRKTEVDMLAAARDAQWSATTFIGPGSIKVVAPAKVNLFLGIGERREDGYHTADTVMHALALHDVIYLNTEPVSADEVAKATEVPLPGRAVGGPADNLLVTIDMSDRAGGLPQVPAADNLAFKAADRLARAVGFTALKAVHLRIEKHIPAQGGLGGGSSDAAAVLVGLAQRWGIAADDERLADVARSLGADVAFFLRGGCVLLGGVGDELVRTLEPSRRAVVLVKPDAGVSTAAAYRRFDESPQIVSAAVRAAIGEATSADVVPLANNLAAASESILPELCDVRAWLAERAGADNVLLCGSGSATFALVDSFDEARRIATAASMRGWWARPTSLAPLRAAIVPTRR